MRSLQSRINRLEQERAVRSHVVAVVRIGGLSDADKREAIRLAGEDGCDVSGLVMAIRDAKSTAGMTLDEWRAAIQGTGNWWRNDTRA